MTGKELIGIFDFGRSFFELKVHFLIARHKIKQIQISNAGNLQSNFKLLKGFFLKGLLIIFAPMYFFGRTMTDLVPLPNKDREANRHSTR